MTGLTPRKRFLNALNREEADRVPVFDAPNNLKLFKRELGRDNFYFQGIPAVRLSKRLGLDACLIPEAGYTGLISRHWKWPDREHFIDELNVEYAVNESSWPLGIPKKPSLKGRKVWEKLKFPDPNAPWR